MLVEPPFSGDIIGFLGPVSLTQSLCKVVGIDHSVDTTIAIALGT
jgi:hypothetical protein